MDTWKEKSFSKYLRVPSKLGNKIYKFSQVLVYNTYHYYVLRIIEEGGNIYVLELNDNEVRKLSFHDVFNLLNNTTFVLKKEYKNRLQIEVEEKEKKVKKTKKKKNKEKIPPFEIRAVMYEIYDEKKKYELVDVIKELDNITIPPDINDYIYEPIKEGSMQRINNDESKEKEPGKSDAEIKGANKDQANNIEINDKKVSEQNSDNDIQMIENIQSNNEKFSSYVENIPKESKTAVVSSQKFEIVNTDLINYASEKKLTRKDKEKYSAGKIMRERIQSIEIDEKTFLMEINQQKLERRSRFIRKNIME